VRGVCAVSSDKRPRARHASRVLRRACGRGTGLSPCVVWLGLGRFGSVWDWILGGIVRVGFSHRESISPDPDPV
jgi:hypothetical protein